jgi:signal transduction histidine kinase
VSSASATILHPPSALPRVILRDDPPIVWEEDDAGAARRYGGPMNLLRSLRARVQRMDPFRADLLLGAFLLVETQVEAWLLPAPVRDRAITSAVFAGLAVGIALRRRAPVIGVVLVFSAYAVTNSLGADVNDNLILPFFALLFSSYSLGANANRRQLAAGIVAIAALTTVAILSDQYDDTAGDLLFVAIVLLAGPILIGRILRNRSRLNRALREKAARQEAERAEQAERAVEEERARIAGELHDVVAHALSAMTVQAGAARRLAERDPDKARAAFGAVERSGRDALAEIRRLLGVLRREDEDLALAPQPSLAHLSTLVQRAQAAGLRVDLAVDGEARALPTGLDLTAYRVVQEALGGATEPGGAGHADVLVRYGADSLELSVLDDGPAEGEPRPLLGVRERVLLYGGELRAGPRRAGGHAVRAKLPIEGGA